MKKKNRNEEKHCLSTIIGENWTEEVQKQFESERNTRLCKRYRNSHREHYTEYIKEYQKTWRARHSEYYKYFQQYSQDKKEGKFEGTFKEWQIKNGVKA